MEWWAWVLIAWVPVSFATALIVGPVLRRNRERYEATEQSWKVHQRRKAAPWN